MRLEGRAPDGLLSQEAGPERLRVARGPSRLVKAPILTLRVRRLPCSTVPPKVLTPSPALDQLGFLQL